MATLAEISKRGPRLTPEQKAEQKRQRTQARVGLGSNVLGLTAGAAATGAALRDERLEHGGRVAQRLYKIGQRIPKPIQNLNERLGAKGKAALAGGALALQAGNMGGDVVANRVLARSAQQGQKPVKKNDGEWMLDGYISKADKTKGAGRSYNDMSDAEFENKLREETAPARRALVARGATSGAVLGGITGSLVGSPQTRKVLRRAGIGGVAGGAAMGGLVHRANEKSIQRVKNDPVQRYRGEMMLHSRARLKERALEAQARRNAVGKAYRRYDPEADRQRRLGLAAGVGAGGGLLLGGAAARNYTTKVALRDGGGHVKGIAVKPKRGKAALLLTGGALASGGAGALAYRKGLSERNNPWN